MNDCDLPDQLCAKVAQYIPKCDCDEYPKLVFKLVYEYSKGTPLSKTIGVIYTYLYITKGIFIKTEYYKFDIRFINMTLNFNYIPQQLLLFKAICGEEHNLERRKHSIPLNYTLKDNTIIIIKNKNNCRRDYILDYYYTCQITPELKKNVKE